MEDARKLAILRSILTDVRNFLYYEEYRDSAGDVKQTLISAVVRDIDRDLEKTK